MSDNGHRLDKHLMDGIDRNPDLKKLFEQLQRKGEKIEEEAAKDPRGESNALRDPLDEYERLEGIFQKNIIEHCQKDVDNFTEQYDGLVNKTSDKEMKGLLRHCKSAGQNFMKEKGKDWKAVSLCISYFWEIESMVHSAERNLGVKPI